MHLNFKAERSTAEREPSSVAVRKLMVVCFTARYPELESDYRDLSAAERASSSGAMQNCNVRGFRLQLYAL